MNVINCTTPQTLHNFIACLHLHHLHTHDHVICYWKVRFIPVTVEPSNEAIHVQWRLNKVNINLLIFKILPLPNRYTIAVVFVCLSMYSKQHHMSMEILVKLHKTVYNYVKWMLNKVTIDVITNFYNTLHSKQFNFIFFLIFTHLNLRIAHW